MLTYTLNTTWRDDLRHYLNPLHVYCALCKVGVARAHAKRAMMAWQGLYDRLLG